MRSDVAVGVTDVVGDAGRGGGIDPVGQLDEHPIGVGDCELV
jgi:hypothetical protein